MAKSLLVVTADNNFGQVLLYGLEQAGYPAFIVKGKGEAVVRTDEKNCDLAFLNMDLVVFSEQEPPAALDEIRPWTLMPKPYYLPDVLNMLNNPSSYSNSVQP